MEYNHFNNTTPEPVSSPHLKSPINDYLAKRECRLVEFKNIKRLTNNNINIHKMYVELCRIILDCVIRFSFFFIRK